VEQVKFQDERTGVYLSTIRSGLITEIESNKVTIKRY
jgi:hypothetical protein